MGSITTQKNQRAKDYLQQVGSILKQKLTPREKVDRISALLPPDDTSINADYIYASVSPWGTPEGMDIDTDIQERIAQAFPLILSQAEKALADYKNGNQYAAKHTWTAFYNVLPIGSDKLTTRQKYEKTFGQSISSRKHYELEKEAVASFPKRNVKTGFPLEYVTYDYAIIDTSGDPIHEDGPEPVKLS